MVFIIQLEALILLEMQLLALAPLVLVQQRRITIVMHMILDVHSHWQEAPQMLQTSRRPAKLVLTQLEVLLLGTRLVKEAAILVLTPRIWQTVVLVRMRMKTGLWVTALIPRELVRE